MDGQVALGRFQCTQAWLECCMNDATRIPNGREDSDAKAAEGLPPRVDPAEPGKLLAADDNEMLGLNRCAGWSTASRKTQNI